LKTPAKVGQFSKPVHGLSIAVTPAIDLDAQTRMLVTAVRNDSRAGLRIVSGNPELYVRRAQAAVAAGKGAQAIEDLTTGIKLAPSDRSLLLERARAFDGQGATKEAIADCTTALEGKRDIAALQLRATLYERSAQTAKAIDDYSELIKSQPFRADYAFARGKLYRMSGQAQRAGEDFGRAIHLNPTYKLLVARALSETGVSKPVVAKPTLANIIPAAKPAVPEVLVQPDKVILVKSAKTVETPVAQTPKPAPVLAPVEPAVLPQARPEAKTETIVASSAVPKAAPKPVQTAPPPAPKEPAVSPQAAQSASSALQKGRTQFDAKQYAEAVASFTTVIEVRPKSSEGFMRRCMANFMAGNLKPAKEDCDKAIALRMDDADAIYYRGRIQQAEGSLAPAIESYSIAISIKRYFPEAFFYRAQASQSMDDLAAAIYNYSEAARQRQGFTEALQARADIKLQLGDRLGYQKDLDLLKSVQK